jgi:hypothetical protein
LTGVRVLREPLVQFLVLGTALFAAYAAFAPEPEAPRERIVIGTATVERLEAQFAATWGRPPDATERAGLIDAHISEEVLAREALALGLEAEDPAIRRRLGQKMRFLLQESLDLAPPDEAVLLAFHAANRALYTEPERITLEQVFLGERGTSAGWEAVALDLDHPDAPDPWSLGEQSILPPRLEAVTADGIDRIFGDGFAAQLRPLANGSWQGPVASSYGLHLVRVSEVIPGAEPPFEEVRERVTADLRDERARAEEAVLVERLRAGYEIVIEDAR